MLESFYYFVRRKTPYTKCDGIQTIDAFREIKPYYWYRSLVNWFYLAIKTILRAWLECGPIFQ